MRVRLSGGFLTKGMGAGLLVAVADALLWQSGGLGSNLGGFAWAWLAVLLLAAPSVLQDRRARVAVLVAAALAAALVYDPTFFLWVFFAAALMIAALLPRAARFGDALTWGLRLGLQGLVAVIGPWRDLYRAKIAGAGVRDGVRGLLPLLPLPLIGGAIFLFLFASANPVIARAFDGFDPLGLDIPRIVFGGFVLTTVWASLRPRRIRIAQRDFGGATVAIPGVTTGSVTLSLIIFNALFAMQNVLDIAFLWSGAPLPAGVTLADYAHQGAYPLIATALLAGLFVLVALRPGSETARIPAIRALVIVWVLQNVFLVGSTMLRTIDYIDAYSLTRWRIAALVWMALVALGLVLILWRMLTAKSVAWLINGNALAAGLAIAGCSLADIGEVAARWNVAHARDVGGTGAKLDLCYLAALGPSAIVPVVELELGGRLPPRLADDVARVRRDTLRAMLESQKDGDWVWRNAQRLDRVKALIAGKEFRPVRGWASYRDMCEYGDPEAGRLTEGEAR